MATVSRLILQHPPLGTTGGSTLHSQIEALYTKIGDAINSRWYQLADFDTSESVDVEHNFDTDLANLRWKLYVYTGGKWVLTTDETSPTRASFTVVAKTGQEDTHLTVTNVSAGNDLLCALVLINDPLQLEDGDIKDVDIAGATNGQTLVYNSASDKFLAGNLDGANVTPDFVAQNVSTTGSITGGSLNSGVINATGYQDFSPVTTPANPTGKLRVYAKSDNKLYTKTAGGIEQAVGSGGSVLLINKTGHGFIADDVGCPVYLDSSGDYVKARADLLNTSEVAGLINKYIDTDNFEVCLGGEVTPVGANASGAMTPGVVYFLSTTTAGAITDSEPTVIGHISKPVGIARSATAIDFFNMRGSVVGSGNARTQITLANNATTTVQNVSVYDAGELAGWVMLTNTTAANSLRFYVQAPFAKYGGSSNYYISPAYVGDTPPAGFAMTVTAGGLIQITMPNWSGYSSAVINFALNAPAVGTNFPLRVDGTQITGGTVGASYLPAATSTTNGVVKYEESSFTGTLTGVTTTVTTTIKYVRINNTVCLTIPPSFTGTSNTTSCTITGFPASIQPSNTQNLILQITNSGTTTASAAYLTTSTLTMYATFGGGGFTSSGTKGLGNGATFSYILT